MNEALDSYVPIDRLHALAAGAALPIDVQGAALGADLSGFTALTEALARELGEKRGAEELTRRMNIVWDALVGTVHRFGGTVLTFSGDAFTCWLDGDDGLRGATCGQALQRWLDENAAGLGAGSTPLRLKVAVATGKARRFCVGDRQVQLLEGVAGALVDELTDAGDAAGPGEIVLARSAADSLGSRAVVEGAGVLTRLQVVADPRPWPQLDGLLSGMDELVRPWLLPAVYERLRGGQGDFLAELRPTVALFLRFPGIEFEHDPDALSRLDAFVQAAQAVLAPYEGTLADLTIGDKGSYLYAAFGAPVAHEDDRVRALLAALELRELGRDGLVDPVSIGVVAGLTWAGSYGGAGRRTYGILGDAVNLSARLMQAAGPGEVITAKELQDAAGESFRWGRLPDLTVKGKSEPVAVACLVGARSAGTARRRPGVERLPMLGRDAELETVVAHFEQALAGQGQVVGIEAEAGMGKSRLIAEVVAAVRSKGIGVHLGECPSYGVNGGYLVWRAIWNRLWGLSGLSPNRRRAAAAAQLERAGSALGARLPLLGPLLGLDIPDNDLTRAFDAKLRKTSLESGLSEWLRATTDRPIVFVLDDCHWIDSLSEDLLEVLGRAVRELPILVVLAYRPRDQASGGQLSVAALPHFSAVRLQRLPDEEVGRLIRLRLEKSGATGEFSEEAVARVVERAEGNPFYVEELVNYLTARGASVGDDTLDELPSSVQSLILSRIDRLDERARATLKVASVIARTFPADMLAPVHPALGSAEEVRASLTTLGGLDFVLLEREAEQVYAFKHAITQDVAYSTIASMTRASLHGRIGRLLEERAGADVERQLDLLAYHFRRGDDEPRKRSYLLRAGEAARARYANGVAIDYLREAASLVSGRERVDVLLKLGKAFELTGRWDDAGESYTAALALAHEHGDPHAEAWCETAEGELLRKQGSYEKSAALLQAARTKFAEAGDQAGVAQVLHATGTLASLQGQHALAQERYEQSVALRRELGDRWALATTLNNLGIVAENQADYETAARNHEEALAIQTELGDRWAIAIALNNLGVALLLGGHAKRARPLLEQGVAQQREIGDPAMLANFLCNSGNAACALGDYDATRTRYRESLRLARDIRDLWLTSYLLEDTAVLAARTGDPIAALRLAAAGARLRDEIGAPRPDGSRQELDDALKTTNRAVTAAQRKAAVRAGTVLSLDQAISEALEACDGAS